MLYGRTVWLAIALAGCASTVKLVEATPVKVTGSVPDEDPEPAPKPERVEVKQDRIEVSETILFDFSSSRISDESHDVLDEIAEVITKHPNLKKIRVEGHTDSAGDSPHNLALSKKRAAAVVKYLVEQGVDAGRLVAEGFGQSKPIASNDTEEDRAKNRRVAFVIVDQTAADGSADEDDK